MMSKEEIKLRKEWANSAYENMKTRKTNSLKILGRELIVPSEVFIPHELDAELIGRAILRKVKKTDRVLDLGTGSGINAILAANKSSKVIGTDINLLAIKCAKNNAKINNLADKIKFLKSDLFAKVRGKFDWIIFNPPFRWFKPRDMLERSIADENYQTLTKFFKEVKEYLKPKGKILIFFGDSGDLNYLKSLIKENIFRRKELRKKSIVKYSSRYWYYCYELSRINEGLRQNEAVKELHER